MEAEVQHGRRKTSSKKVDKVSEMFQLPDLRQVTVLSKAEWQRIQHEVDQHNPEKERVTEEAKQREGLHQQSVEVVKQWSNTIAGQRQKKLEAKKIRDEIEEEKRKEIDREEAAYQAQMRKEAVEKAKTQLYYQSDIVRGLHSALLLTEVLKEREAQIDLKQRVRSTTREVEKHLLDVVKSREEDAQRQEEERERQRRMEVQAVAEDLRKQMRENKLLRERQKMENQREGEEIQQLTELYQREQRMERESHVKQKEELLQAHLEHVANRDSIRATEEEQQRAEEQQRKLFLSAKDKMMKLRKDREMELLREAQRHRESIMRDMTEAQREQAVGEEQRLAKAVAEQDARRAQQWWEEEERRAAALRSIRAHRELTRQEKEQRERAAKQKARDELEAKREADRTFKEKQRSKARQIKQDRRTLQDFNATQTAEKSAKREQLRQQERELEKMNEELMADEARRFHQYSQQVIGAAAEGQRNVIPLCKAVREAFRGGSDPLGTGVRAVYLVQDRTGAPMPQYVSEEVKKLNRAVDVQAQKKRLGFTW